MTSNLKICPVLIYAIVTTSPAAGVEITLFEHEDHNGDSHKVNIQPGQCYNLPQEWNDRTSSIDTHENCAVVFEDLNCIGKSIRVEPGSPSHRNLGDLDFNDKITSLRACSPQTGSNGGQITFYEHVDYTGEFVNVNIEPRKCTHLPSGWSDRASSINTNDNCVVVFADGDCKGKSARVEPGTPSHRNLQDIDFNDKIDSIHECTPPERACSGITVHADTSQVPDLYEYGQKVKHLLERLFPEHCRLFYSGSYIGVQNLYIKFDPAYKGVAEARVFGEHVTANPQFYRDHPNDIGSLVHEMGHIIGRFGYSCPGWIDEGSADWLRRFHYEKVKPQKPRRDVSWTQDGGVYFMDWIDRKYKIMKKMIATCREENYKDELFQIWTGKSLDQLWNDMHNE